MRIARHSDLIALAPYSGLGDAPVSDQAADLGLESFELPIRMPEFNGGLQRGLFITPYGVSVRGRRHGA
jgi:hypothetical protein